MHEKFKMQIPMRTSSNFFLRNTNIHKSMSIYRNENGNLDFNRRWDSIHM